MVPYTTNKDNVDCSTHEIVGYETVRADDSWAGKAVQDVWREVTNHDTQPYDIPSMLLFCWS